MIALPCPAAGRVRSPRSSTARSLPMLIVVRRRPGRRARRGVRARAAPRTSSRSRCTLVALVGAFAAARRLVSRDQPDASPWRGLGRHRRAGAVPAGHPPVLAILGVLIDGRALDGVGATRSPRGRRHPGLEPGGVRHPRRARHTEVFPLMLFAVVGMMLFPAANDLLTMFVALEVLSLPLYLLCGLARRRRLLTQEAALKYFLLGAFSSAFFLYGSRCSTASPARSDFARHRRRRSPQRPATSTACSCPGMVLVPSACSSRSARCRSTRGRPTSTRARRPRSPASWPPAPRSRRSARCCGCFYVGFGGDRWDWQPMLWVVAILTMVVGAVLGGHPDRHQAHAGLLLDRARRASSSSACWPSTQAGDRRACCSTSSPTASRRSARSPWSRLVRDGGWRGHAPVAVGRPGQAATRSSPASSRSCCWPSPASR